MEADNDILLNGRQPQFFLSQMEDDLNIFLQMEDDLNFFQMAENLKK